ncbi:MAG: CBS domain-containing protein [Spongiibacteraceae bacterium]|jgi:CBS domain-containing protein|nr:CBS domain-containing protein [Spongiibacteraceae bacterium]
MRAIPAMGEVMSPLPHSITASASLAEAATLMEMHTIGHLPVFADGDLIGVFSLRDLERGRILGHPLSETDLVVGDLCAGPPWFVDVDDPLDRVLESMATSRLSAALVLQEGDLAGIFTAFDACRLLATWLQRSSPPVTTGAHVEPWRAV